MLSYNSNYEDSNVFTLGGMTTVGLTDCGLQCKVACGCNTANGWYRAVPDGNYTSRTSVKSYDFIIGDDGKLASSGTTLSSSGKSLSGSTKSLSAGGSTITCTKQTCSDGYITTKPGVYFSYDTETLRHGEECYNVTGCASGYASNGTGSGTTLDGYTCYKIQYYTVTIEASLDDLNNCPSSLTSKVGSTVSSCTLDGSSCTPSLGSSTTKTIRRVRGSDSYSISLGQDGCYTMGSDGTDDWYLYSNGIMKNGEYMSTEVGTYGPSASDTITGDVTYSLMFNCGKGQCPEDCEYTTTSSDCSNACKYLSDNTCVINGTTYYKECGSTKCDSDETCNGSGTCVCDYSTTKASCDTECKYTGTQCSDGTAYYNGCGSSKCASDEECYNGDCGCKYTTTKATCDAECKYTGTQCSNGTAYYDGCGSSKCSNGQICLNGSCHTHYYECPTGYSNSSSGFIEAASTTKTKTCSCEATTSGTCYYEGHSHYYECPTGYSANSSDFTNPVKESVNKTCSVSGCTAKTTGDCWKQGKIYYCDVTGSLSCSGLSTTECTISLSIDPRDSGVTVGEEPSASVSYSCDCVGTSGSSSGNLGFNGGVGYFQDQSFTVRGTCTSCSASITSASPNPISAGGVADSCVVSIGNISGWTNNGTSEPEDDVSWYTEVLDKDYPLSDGVNVWTNHISRACITGSTSKATSINLNCTVSFRGGIDPNYPGGFSESSCSGGDYDDTVLLTLNGDGTNCEVVYETPCLVNEINCSKL